MDKAIEWARQTNLKVYIDLHGAPGSQNGFDNSGHLIKAEGGSLGWTSGDTVKQTLSVLREIVDKYAQQKYQDVVVAIELLNEPLPDRLLGTDAVVQFSKDGYGEVREVSDTPVIVHDAFQNGSFWNDILVPGDAFNGDFILQRIKIEIYLTASSSDRSSRVPGLKLESLDKSID